MVSASKQMEVFKKKSMMGKEGRSVWNQLR